MSVRVFILRADGGEDGPYGEGEVMDALEAGELSPLDWCRLGDEPQAQRLGEVFEHVDAGRRTREMAAGGELEEEAIDPTDSTHPAEDDGEADEDGEDVDEERDEPEEEDVDEEGEEEEQGEEEEILVYRGTPSVLAYAPALGVAAGVLAAGYWAGQFGVKWVTGGLAVGLFLVVRVLLHRGAREYVVTSRWVQSTSGWLSKSVRRILLSDLSAIRLHRKGVLGWLGVGTIVFSGRGGPDGDVVFERISRARRVIARVRERQESGRK